MAKIKWLGDAGGAEETTGFGGIAMKKGEWVDCDDPNILKRAKKNKYFEVEGYAEGDTVDVSKDVTVKPPSQQTAQYPVPKHGDVTTLEATVPNPPDPVDPDPPAEETPAKTQGFAPIPPAKK